MPNLDNHLPSFQIKYSAQQAAAQPTHRLLRRQNGAAMAETMLSLLPVLLVGSLAVEIARGYQTRHLLTLALHETARIAAVRHGNPKYWQPALQQALTRLFLPPGRFNNALERQEHERRRFQKKYGQPMWHAEITSTRMDTLHLKMTYLYQPTQPWLSWTLGKLHTATQIWTAADTPNQHAWRQGLIPIFVEYRVIRHRSIASLPNPILSAQADVPAASKAVVRTVDLQVE